MVQQRRREPRTREVVGDHAGRSQHDRGGEEGGERRQDAQGAPQVGVAEPDAAGLLPLPAQQGVDGVPGQEEGSDAGAGTHPP